MLPASELACDFTRVADSTGSWQVCAIRRTQRDAWCALFAQAGLVLRRLTLLPCALRTLARLVGEAPTVPLIHGDGQRFCWIAPWGQPLQYGCIPCEAGWRQLAPLGRRRRRRVRNLPALTVWSRMWPDRLGSFSLLRHRSAPLPREPAQCCVALGLALMAETPQWTI